MDANPIGLVVIAIAALIAIIVLLVTHTHEVAHVFDLMRHDVAAAVDALVSFVKSHWQMLATILATVLLGPVGFLVAFLATHWKTVEHDVLTVVNAVTGFFQKLPGRILGALERLPGDLLAVGRNIIEGLLHGIEDAASGLLSEVSSLAGDVEHAFTDPLSIFSPSRVMHEHGANYVQGIIDGIKSRAADLKATAGSLAAGIGAPGAAVPTGSAMTHQVNVNLTGTPAAAGNAFQSPQYQQALQQAVQEVTLRYAQLNPSNGLTPAWGR